MIAIIPARAGSKALPGKNVRLLRGHPLIAWTIDAALRSGLFERVVVSTDGEEIAKAAVLYGAAVIRRPDELATDTAASKDAVIHACSVLAAEGVKPDHIVLLQPTSPLRTPADILETVTLVTDKGFDSAASISLAVPNPLRAFFMKEDGRLVAAFPEADIWVPRQQHQPCYHLNGAVYVAAAEDMLTPSAAVLTGSIGGHIMPPERSVDIDTAYDLRIAEVLMEDRPEPRQFMGQG